ncbi:hypothetical protein WJX73_000622 [Symbiochloris irregularis]|uniref:Protein kinase domain-containing protein n=1 Tax=Symbiochloris irregularis TaxID=706552 RepID=A0AAW1NMQ2_9CHLO
MPGKFKKQLSRFFSFPATKSAASKGPSESHTSTTQPSRPSVAGDQRVPQLSNTKSLPNDGRNSNLSHSSSRSLERSRDAPSSSRASRAEASGRSPEVSGNHSGRMPLSVRLQQQASLSGPKSNSSADPLTGFQRTENSLNPDETGEQLDEQSSSPKSRHDDHAGSTPVSAYADIWSSQAQAPISEIMAQLQQGSVEVRSAAAEKLFAYAAENESARASLASWEIVQALVRLLYDGRERGRMYAAYSLSSMMTPDADLGSYLKAGAVPALICILNTSRVMASRKGAMRALGRLARLDEAAKEIVSAQGLPPIIGLLDCSDAGLVRRCLVVLYFVGADKTELQATLAAAGAVGPVVRLCRSTQPEVQAEAVDVVKVLSRNPRAGRVILDLEGLDILYSIALQGLTTRARTSATKAIQRLGNQEALGPLVRSSPASVFLVDGQGPLAPRSNIARDSGAAELEQFEAAVGSSHSSFSDHMRARAAELLPTQSAQATQSVGQGVTPSLRPAVPVTAQANGSSTATPPLTPNITDSDRARASRGGGPQAKVESLVEMLQGPMQSQVYAAQALANLASDPTSLSRMMAAGAPEHLASILCSDAQMPAMLASAAALERLAMEAQEGPGPMTQTTMTAALIYVLASPLRACHLAVIRTLRQLLRLYPAAGADLAASSGVVVLTRRVCRGEAQVRLVALDLLHHLRQQGHALAGAVPALAAMEHSHQADMRASASSILMQMASDGSSGALITSQRALQMNISMLVSGLQVSLSLQPHLEEAMRVVPRSAFLPPQQAAEAWLPKAVMAAGGPPIVLGPPAAEMLALQALALEAGHCVLDAGSGSGYLTMLAAHVVGEAGASVGVELREPAAGYARACVNGVREARGLGDVNISFIVGSVFDPDLLESQSFDRIVVGAACPKVRLRCLLRLLKPGGRLAVPCEGQLLLLCRPADGGPVPEPTVLCVMHAVDSLVDSASQAGGGLLLVSPAQSPRANSFQSNTQRSNTQSHSGDSKHAMPNGRAMLAVPDRSSPTMSAVGSPGAKDRFMMRNEGPRTNSRSDSSHGGHSQLSSNGGQHQIIRQVQSRKDVREHASRGGRELLQAASRELARGGEGYRLPRRVNSGGQGAGPMPRSSGRSSGSQHGDDDEFNPSDETQSWFISKDDISICRTPEGKKCRLGEGGFGIVYKALMNGVDEVAVKLVKAEKPSPKEMALFHKEVRVMRSLHHRNIVQFYGACLEPRTLFFVTELMKGGDLYSALRHHPDTMHWDRLGRKVAMDVALGINHLHTRRPPMMHRDLKSPNVLLSEEGVAKIADVGMVRAQVHDLVTAQPVMTPLWAAPEVVRHERASIKADIWSYGVLIWEIISRQDITELQPLAIACQTPPDQRQGPTLELPQMSPPIAAHLFIECTQMDPSLRPSAGTIVEWLRRA